MSKHTIPLAAIITDAGTKLRKLDPKNTERLREVLQEGHTFTEPMRVWTDGTSRWLSHGFHRYEAFKAEGVEKVSVELLEGTLQDAMDDACKPHNAEHGLPESPQQRRERIAAYIEHHPKASARTIAEWCGVSDRTVRRMKEESAASSSVSEVVGRDGRAHPAKRPRPPRSGGAAIAAPPQGYVCPNCGGTEQDEDGDCASCREPTGGEGGGAGETSEAGPGPARGGKKSNKPIKALTGAAREAFDARAQLKVWHESLARWFTTIDKYREKWPGLEADRALASAKKFYEELGKWQKKVK